MRQKKSRQLPLKPLLDRLRKIVRRLLERVLRAARSPLRLPQGEPRARHPLDDWWARVRGNGPPAHWLAMLNERSGDDAYPFDLTFPLPTSAAPAGDAWQPLPTAKATAESQPPTPDVAVLRDHEPPILRAVTEAGRARAAEPPRRSGPRKLQIRAEAPSRTRIAPDRSAAPASRPPEPVRRPVARVRAAFEPQSGVRGERAASIEPAEALRPPPPMPPRQPHGPVENEDWEPQRLTDMPSLSAPRRDVRAPHRLFAPHAAGEVRSPARSDWFGHSRQALPGEGAPLPTPAVQSAPFRRAAEQMSRPLPATRPEPERLDRAFPALPEDRTKRWTLGSGGGPDRAVAAHRTSASTGAEAFGSPPEALPAWPTLPDEMPDEDVVRREWRDLDDLARLEREQQGVE